MLIILFWLCYFEVSINLNNFNNQLNALFSGDFAIRSKVNRFDSHTNIEAQGPLRVDHDSGFGEFGNYNQGMHATRKRNQTTRIKRHSFQKIYDYSVCGFYYFLVLVSTTYVSTCYKCTCLTKQCLWNLRCSSFP